MIEMLPNSDLLKLSKYSGSIDIPISKGRNRKKRKRMTGPDEVQNITGLAPNLQAGEQSPGSMSCLPDALEQILCP